MFSHETAVALRHISKSIQTFAENLPTELFFMHESADKFF